MDRVPKKKLEELTFLDTPELLAQHIALVSVLQGHGTKGAVNQIKGQAGKDCHTVVITPLRWLCAYILSDTIETLLLEPPYNKFPFLGAFLAGDENSNGLVPDDGCVMCTSCAICADDVIRNPPLLIHPFAHTHTHTRAHMYIRRMHCRAVLEASLRLVTRQNGQQRVHV